MRLAFSCRRGLGRPEYAGASRLGWSLEVGSTSSSFEGEGRGAWPRTKATLRGADLGGVVTSWPVGGRESSGCESGLGRDALVIGPGPEQGAAMWQVEVERPRID